MPLPYSGYQYTRVQGTAAGTAQISDGPINFVGALIGQQQTGTVTLYDNSGGTSAATYVIALDNTVGTVSQFVGPINVQFKKGLTYGVGGTTDMVLVWDRG